MAKYDLAGKRFGKLVAIQYDNAKSKWLCKCDCGKEHYTSRRNLLWNGVKSCGCEAKRLIDISGKQFGSLTSVCYDKAKKKWLCKCECGNEVYVRSQDLRDGKRISCGCKNKTRLINLTGKKFGMLQVVQRAPKIVSNESNTLAQWICICDCGKPVVANSRSLRKGFRFGCPECQELYNRIK